MTRNKIYTLLDIEQSYHINVGFIFPSSLDVIDRGSNFDEQEF